jgi:hypothetical protein
MTINPKPDLAIKSANEQAMVQQSLSNARAQAANTEDPSALTHQDTDTSSAVRQLNDTLDLSANIETNTQPSVDVKDEITSVSMAEGILESVSGSILNRPEEAMQAQANSLPQSVLELIR